jgi:hypothetical protein
MRTRWVLGAVALLFAAGALLYIHRLRTLLEQERQRVYVLADALEVLQTATRKGGVFELDSLPRSRVITANDVTRPGSLGQYPPGTRLYMYDLTMDEQTRREYDRKYRTPALLDYGPSVLVDKQGRIFAIEWWDKP